MITIEQLKHYKQVDNSITYDIHGLSESEVEFIYLQLCDKYNKVASQCDYACLAKSAARQLAINYLKDNEYLTEHWLFN